MAGGGEGRTKTTPFCSCHMGSPPNKKEGLRSTVWLIDLKKHKAGILFVLWWLTQTLGKYLTACRRMVIWCLANTLNKCSKQETYDYFFMSIIQHCFICRLSDYIVSEDAGIEPRTVATVDGQTQPLDLILTWLDLTHNLARSHQHLG